MLTHGLSVQDDGTTVSTNTRVVKEVQAPATQKPTDEQFYTVCLRTGAVARLLTPMSKGRKQDKARCSISKKPFLQV